MGVTFTRAMTAVGYPAPPPEPRVPRAKRKYNRKPKPNKPVTPTSAATVGALANQESFDEDQKTVRAQLSIEREQFKAEGQYRNTELLLKVAELRCDAQIKVSENKLLAQDKQLLARPARMQAVPSTVKKQRMLSAAPEPAPSPVVPDGSQLLLDAPPIQVNLDLMYSNCRTD
jgi:hypothetical protein